MKFSLTQHGEGFVVDAYEPGRVVVSGTSHRQSIVILPDRIITEWDPQSVTELTDDHFRVIADLQPDVVLLGTGPKQLFPPPGLYVTLLDQGIGIEMMDTASACRTYNLLMAEGRKVAAVLLLN